jgi:hypothetical protein
MTQDCNVVVKWFAYDVDYMKSNQSITYNLKVPPR